MPVATAAVGRATRAHRETIDPDRALAFALATDDTNPRYRAGELAAPLVGVVATAAAVFDLYAQIFTEFPAMQLVHLSQDVRVLAPLVPGSAITTVACAEAVRRTPAGTAVYLRTDSVGDDGAPLISCRATVLVPGRTDAEDVGEPPPDDRPATLRRARTRTRRDVSVATDQALRFCAASGDWQPIHIDERAARAAGLPGVVLHGMCTLALTSREAVDVLADGNPTRVARIAARFASPVQPGRTLSIGFSEPVPVDGIHVHGLRVECEGRAALRNGRVDVRP